MHQKRLFPRSGVLTIFFRPMVCSWTPWYLSFPSIRAKTKETIKSRRKEEREKGIMEERKKGRNELEIKDILSKNVLTEALVTE